MEEQSGVSLGMISSHLFPSCNIQHGEVHVGIGEQRLERALSLLNSQFTHYNKVDSILHSFPAFKLITYLTPPLPLSLPLYGTAF